MQWMNEIADRRVVRGDTKTIAERFAEEAPHLLPLPRRPYDTARVVYRLCDAEACIAFEGNRYEVPYAQTAAFLPVRVTATEVRGTDCADNASSRHPDALVTGCTTGGEILGTEVHDGVVVEAAVQSGSLITARQANEQGRDVFAIPGSINNPLARGCHQLIRDGAVLCESVDDIVSVLAAQASALGDRLRCVLRPLQQAEAEFPGPDESPALAGRDAVYQRLIAAMGFDEVHLDMLVAQTGLDVATLSSMLLVLELEGEVVAAGGGSYQRIAATD